MLPMATWFLSKQERYKYYTLQGLEVMFSRTLTLSSNLPLQLFSTRRSLIVAYYP